MMKKLTFEAADAELDAILEQLADESTTLEKALALYARATELIAFCNDTLKNAQMQVEEIDARLQA